MRASLVTRDVGTHCARLIRKGHSSMWIVNPHIYGKLTLTISNTFVIMIPNRMGAVMLRTAVRRVGNSLGITLPKTIVENYHLSEGDELHLVETDEGVVLTPFNPKFAEWAIAYERTNKKFRNTLKALAK